MDKYKVMDRKMSSQQARMFYQSVLFFIFPRSSRFPVAGVTAEFMGSCPSRRAALFDLLMICNVLYELQIFSNLSKKGKL